MSETEKQKDTAVVAEQPETTQVQPDGSKDQKEESNIDYKAELERVSKQLVQAEYTITKLKKEPKADEPETTVEPAKAELENATKYLLDNAVKSAIALKTKNADEASLVLFHFNNSIVRTGDLETDLERAYVLANGRKINQTVAEVKRMSSVPVSTPSGSAGAPKEAKQTPQLTEAEKRFTRPPYNLTVEEILKARGE